VRYLQYLPYFVSHGVEISVVPLFSDAYIRALYSGRPRWREVIAGYGRRVLALLGVSEYDLVIIEKELFPFFPALVERLLHTLGVPYVSDYDDALFHRYDQHASVLVRKMLGRKIDSVMRNSAIVVAGNEYLAARAREAGARRVEVIPTVVDTDSYEPKGEFNGTPIVGWIGTPGTSKYLQPLLPVFRELQKQMDVRFVAVGARQEDFAGTPVEAWAWSQDTEAETIRQFDIGIMPLPDSPFERGKCGYKLIQYMVAAIPVIASPVGVNKQIVRDGENGYLATNNEEWMSALVRLLESDHAKRSSMGIAGRYDVDKWYSLRVQAPRLLKILQDAVDAD
jgi:glycosyltransferase involved in cell wall biosynthesis